jgi:hypothetical protein
VLTVQPVTATDVDGLVALDDDLSDDDRYRQFLLRLPAAATGWPRGTGSRRLRPARAGTPGEPSVLTPPRHRRSRLDARAPADLEWGATAGQDFVP